MSPIKALKLFLITFSIIFTNNLIAQTVYVTNTGEKYHVVNCRYLKYSQNETTIKKAKDLGYLACKVCKPTVENTPKIKPKNKAIPMEESANTKVFLKVFPSIEVTEVPLRTNDSLRYGTLKTRV